MPAPLPSRRAGGDAGPGCAGRRPGDPGAALARAGALLAQLLLLLGLATASAAGARAAQAQEARAGTVAAQSADVVVDGRLLFRVVGTTAFPAAERARRIERGIEALAADPARDPANLRIEDMAIATVVKYGDERVLQVVDDDAELEGLESRLLLASAWVERVQRAVADYRADRTPDTLLRAGVFAAAATVLLALALLLVDRLRRRVDRQIETRLEARLQDLRIQNVPIVYAKQMAVAARAARRLFWIAIWIVLILVYLEFALSRFVWTRPLANRALDLIVGPLQRMSDGVLEALPGLAFIAVLGFVVYWLLRTGRMVFDAVETGSIRVAGFEPEWATPTFRILRAVVLAFTLVIAYPYLPGSSSEAFKGISVFIGVMLSLGAASMIGNLLAGYSMIYRRAFRVGDRIQVGEHIGDVTHIRAMVTHLRTPKNEEVIVPNSRLLGEQVINYSSLARTDGLILHTTVGIGYETPWRQVEAMLLLAAGRTAALKAEPAPFVLQKSLGDFCVVYEINVYVDDAQAMGRITTDLHRHILDVFNEYGVQIMTPAYEGDTEQPKVVPRSQWHAAPARPEGAAAEPSPRGPA
jgi:small-conductance mechanosensitive channel